MDTGCGCGCDGKEVSKASSQCTKRTKKTSSTRKGKKWMACVPNGKGGYKRVHWGQRGVSVTGKRGNTKRKNLLEQDINVLHVKVGIIQPVVWLVGIGNYVVGYSQNQK